MRRFDEEVRLSKKSGVDGEEESLDSRQGDQVILESVKRKWSQRFLDLAGSAPDFPYPEEPVSTEPGPDLGRPPEVQETPPEAVQYTTEAGECIFEST
jgi:hypothetical protein